MNNNQKDMIIDVPYCSQIDEIHKNGVEKAWANQSCGIISLKMVLDFFLKEQIDIKELLDKGLEMGAFIEDVGWSHIGLVNLASEYGLYAWRRRFYLNDGDKSIFEKEGVGDPSLKIFDEQLENEGIFSIRDSIRKKCPVIISIPKNFEIGEHGHLVVVTGVKVSNLDTMDIEGFYVNDPYNPDGEDRKGEFVNLEKFKNWNKRALFFRYL